MRPGMITADIVSQHMQGRDLKSRSRMQPVQKQEVTRGTVVSRSYLSRRWFVYGSLTWLREMCHNKQEHTCARGDSVRDVSQFAAQGTP